MSASCDGCSRLGACRRSGALGFSCGGGSTRRASVFAQMSPLFQAPNYPGISTATPSLPRPVPGSRLGWSSDKCCDAQALCLHSLRHRVSGLVRLFVEWLLCGGGCRDRTVTQPSSRTGSSRPRSGRSIPSRNFTERHMIDQFLPSIDEVRADRAGALLKWDGVASVRPIAVRWSLRKSRLTTCGLRTTTAWRSRCGQRWQITGLSYRPPRPTTDGQTTLLGRSAGPMARNGWFSRRSSLNEAGSPPWSLKKNSSPISDCHEYISLRIASSRACIRRAEAALRRVQTRS